MLFMVRDQSRAMARGNFFRGTKYTTLKENTLPRSEKGGVNNRRKKGCRKTFSLVEI